MVDVAVTAPRHAVLLVAMGPRDGVQCYRRPMTPAGERHKAPQHHRFQESDRTATG